MNRPRLKGSVTLGRTIRFNDASFDGQHVGKIRIDLEVTSEFYLDEMTHEQVSKELVIQIDHWLTNSGLMPP